MKKVNKGQLGLLMFSRHFPDFNDYQAASGYNFLVSKARKLHALDEANCNGTIDETEYTIKRDRAIQSVLSVHPKLFAYHQSDPRGASLYVGTVKLTQDNYNNYGICVL